MHLNKLKTLYFNLFLATSSFFILASKVLADESGCNGASEICNPIQAKTITEFIKTILEGAIRIGIPIIALAVIYCGFLFVKAQGNSEEISKAKDALLYTLIGAAILLGSWGLAQLISETVLAL